MKNIGFKVLFMLLSLLLYDRFAMGLNFLNFGTNLTEEIPKEFKALFRI